MLVAFIGSLFKYIRYKVVNRNKAKTSAVNAEGPPILILEYNNKDEKDKQMMISFIIIMLCLFGLFAADWIARKDMNWTSFSLSKEQTHILYYWTWTFTSILGLLFVSIVLISLRVNKRVVFYKNMIVLENSVFGKKVLVLDSGTVWKSGAGALAKAARIYDSKAGFFSTIFVRNSFMKLSPDQDKLLDEILTKIPKKN